MGKQHSRQDVYTFDLLHVLRMLWKKAWLIALVGILAGILGFTVSAFIIPPQYSSSVMLYVNNSSFSLGSGLSITPSELVAAQSLVKTYTVILQNRTTLEKVIEKADVPYTYEELEKMITAASVNDTEILQVTVTSTDPHEAAKIVNVIAEVLPRRIAEIIEGSSMEVVDYGAVNLKKVFPSITGFTALSLILGMIASAGVIFVMAIWDDTIRDEEYVLQAYDYPILAKIPDFVNDDAKSYGYYYKKQPPSK